MEKRSEDLLLNKEQKSKCLHDLQTAIDQSERPAYDKVLQYSTMHLGLLLILPALSYQLCGFLLWNFKSSDGWPKLWVVFFNFCMYFFKNYQESAPLASLPLISYRVG
ncbi:hypothetical protein RvY_11724 [Ramazzottius varieornatus]|uniref:Uncharacterized protein n=1 Tax=Ramazzottius varieornatus TaxID=947166 RepID=A0A1D1VH39_RAMVA|nr:hypothetical protein RvY_11724 [Ramazzottius varieornatus]